MISTANFPKDSYGVSLQIEEIENERKRDLAREELSHLEELYEALSQIDDVPAEWMFCQVDDQPFLAIDNIEIYSITNYYKMVIPSPPSQIKSNVDIQTISQFLQGIYSPVGMAA